MIGLVVTLVTHLVMITVRLAVLMGVALGHALAKIVIALRLWVARRRAADSVSRRGGRLAPRPPVPRSK